MCNCRILKSRHFQSVYLSQFTHSQTSNVHFRGFTSQTHPWIIGWTRKWNMLLTFDFGVWSHCDCSWEAQADILPDVCIFMCAVFCQNLTVLSQFPTSCYILLLLCFKLSLHIAPESLCSCPPNARRQQSAP